MSEIQVEISNTEIFWLVNIYIYIYIVIVKIDARAMTMGLGERAITRSVLKVCPTLQTLETLKWPVEPDMSTVQKHHSIATTNRQSLGVVK